METEPLFIPFLRRHPNYHHHHHLSSSSSTPPSLYPLPEHEPLTLPTPSPLTIPQPSSSSPPSAPLTPTELKNHLIFGSPFSSPSTNITIDALTLDSCTPCHHLDPSSPITSLISPSSFLFSKSNLHRSKTAPAISIINDLAHPHDSSHPKPSISSPYQVRQAAFLLLMYLTFGVIIYTYFQSHFDVKATHPVVDALYFCIVTMCTIGYGDITPNSCISKLFSILFVLVGFGFIDIFLSGMVGYVLDLQENLLLSIVKGGGKHELAKTYIFDLKKGRMRIRMKVGLALGVVILCIGVGTGVMHFVEHLGWLDSFYLSVMSVTTVGYGDHAFTSLPGRMFASVWLLVSTLAVARAFLYLVEARIDKRHRMMAKMVLGQDMTVAEFLAADIDNNGFVSKSEYVIYKLKEMGKIAEKDILQICNQFDRLDAGNCGKITLADLMENHH